MATENEKQLDNFQKRYDSLSSLVVNSRTGKYTVDGKEITAAQYKKVLSSAKKELDAAKKTVKAEKEKTFVANKKTKEAQQAKDKKLDELRKEREGLLGFNAVDANKIAQGWVQDPEFTQKQIDERVKRINEIDKIIFAPGQNVPISQGGQGPSLEMKPPATAGDFRKAEGFAPGKKPKTTTKTNKTGTGADTVSIDGKKVKVGSEQWKTIIQQEFGSMWDVYNSNPDVKAIIDKSIKEGWYNDEIKLSTSLQNTGWYRTTQQSARQFAIQQSTDPATLESRITAQIEEIRTNALNQGVSFSDATLRKLATDSIKYNWSDQQKLNALGSEQVAQAQLGGPQGMADLRRSGTARNLRQKAASFFQKPSEDLIESWTQQILLGQKSEQQWDELMRSSARTQFRSLQPALDRGDDVETAMYAYKQQAQATLGSAIDTTQIDWTQDKWNKALNYRDEKSGEYRQMDLWEWNKYLRTLPEWQNTQEAKDAYRNVAYSLAQGFGKMA